jgi:hypothetical protein
MFNNGGKQTERRTIRLSLIIYAVLLICAVVDLALSYNFFLQDTKVFITTETNSEFVDFLTKGDIPILNIVKFLIAFPLLLFILSWFDILRENIGSHTMVVIERIGRALTVAVPSFFCVSFSCSGFTWYTNSGFIYDILSMVETMIQSSIMIVTCRLFLLTFYLFCDQQKTM